MKLLLLFPAFCLLAVLSACHGKTDQLPEISFPADTTVVLHKRFVAYDDSSVAGGLRFHLNAREELDSAWRSFSLDMIHSTSRDHLKWNSTDKVLMRFFDRGIQLLLLDKTKKAVAIITAGKAVYSPGKKEFIFSENVILCNPKGDSLFTGSLKWQRNRSLFTTDEAIVLKSRKGELRGEGFEASETFDRYMIRNVKGTMPVDRQE